LAEAEGPQNRGQKRRSVLLAPSRDPKSDDVIPVNVAAVRVRIRTRLTVLPCAGRWCGRAVLKTTLGAVWGRRSPFATDVRHVGSCRGYALRAVVHADVPLGRQQCDGVGLCGQRPQGLAAGQMLERGGSGGGHMCAFRHSGCYSECIGHNIRGFGWCDVEDLAPMGNITSDAVCAVLDAHFGNRWRDNRAFSCCFIL
jgi:hypothetical protein